MEPRIQYARTEDGVSIAYYALGEGPAILTLTALFSHLEAEWRVASLKAIYTAAAETSTLVRLDPRGFGLSDRNPGGWPLDGMVLDIEAVVGQLGLEAMRIYALNFMSVPALAYAARHPDVVTHLVLSPAAAKGQDLYNERFKRIIQLAEVDPELATETAARTMNPDLPEDLVRDYAAVSRESIDIETYVQFIDDMLKWDATEEAKSLATPTLLLHLRNNPNYSMETTRSVAGLIKSSRIAFVGSEFEGPLAAQGFFAEGVDTRPNGAQESLATASYEAPGGSSHQPRSSEQAAKVSGGFATILFTDMAGSTALAQRLGDEGAQEVRRAHNDIVRAALSANDGSEIKHTGDGIMASFSTASSALDAAIAIQCGVAEHKRANPDSPLAVYVGLNAGEPIAEDDDLFGTSVDLAARICDHAEPGQILVANVVRELAAGKQFLFSDQGDTELRGFEDPVKLWELRWQEED